MAKVAFTAAHSAASEIGLAVLKEGGNAVDAMVAAAAAIAVTYPHMNGLGGDGFWLVQPSSGKPYTIDACGYAGSKATPANYASGKPERGPRAAITLAGTVHGWHTARQCMPSKLPLARLLGPAQELAKQGITVTESLAAASAKTQADLLGVGGFADAYLNQGECLKPGATLVNPALADTLEQLHCCDLALLDFYRGDIAQTLSRHLASVGSPITRDDLAAYEALVGSPLSVRTQRAQLFNLGPPTQGLASLIILALYDRLYQTSWSEAQRVHHIIEATKIAFTVRDSVIGHRATMAQAPEAFLTTDWLDQAAAGISSETAAPWPNPSQSGDTVWMGALDGQGNMVSFIQSLYWEFGSGLVIPELGVVWNNRGVSFSLEAGHHNLLGPGRRPLHTLNPAFAELSDGRRMVYGTMGGEGQPQTQTALFTRHVYDGLPLTEAIAKDRWLLGRTWGEASTNLKLEQRSFDEIGPALLAAGHDAVAVPSHIEAMGHAGAIALDAKGQVEAATDPRSDGAALVAQV